MHHIRHHWNWTTTHVLDAGSQEAAAQEAALKLAAQAKATLLVRESEAREAAQKLAGAEAEQRAAAVAAREAAADERCALPTLSTYQGSQGSALEGGGFSFS